MNAHKDAKLTPAGRAVLVRRIEAGEPVELVVREMLVDAVGKLRVYFSIRCHARESRTRAAVSAAVVLSSTLWAFGCGDGATSPA